MRRLTLACVFFSAASCAHAVGVDLHRLWDDRCAGCHGHAGEFARKHLVLIDGTLTGRRLERDLREFLANHYPGDADVQDIHAMLLAQASSPARFRDRCSACHQRASDLARGALVLRDGVLYGRASNRRVDRFLAGHAGLADSEVPFFVQLLERVERETSRP